MEPSRSVTGFHTGLSGTAEDVRAQVMESIVYDRKMDLLDGCLKAFREGRPENIRVFFAGYHEFKASRGRKDRDEGAEKLFVRPALKLMDESAAPAETLKQLVSAMPEEPRQAALDMTLCFVLNRRFETEHLTVKTVNAILDAGANPDADCFSAIKNAEILGQRDILKALHDHGADFHGAARHWFRDARAVALVLLGQEFKIEDIRSRVAEMTAQVNDLQKAVLNVPARKPSI